jgi:hypothetical protein
MLRELSDPVIHGDEVVFAANNYVAGGGIFKGNGGPLTTIVKVGDPAPVGTFKSFIGDPSFDGETIAFRASFGTASFESEGIFVARQGEISPVVQWGDSLFGNTVRFLDLGRYGLDEKGSGNVAFNYGLTNRTHGVAIAAVIPEPASIVLIVLLVGSHTLRRCRTGF